MTNDDFLSQLRADWQCQTIDVDGLAARVEARRRRAGMVLAGNAITAVGMPILALAFGVAAIRLGDALFGVAALAFLLGTFASFFEMLEQRRAVRLRYDDSPAGLLRQARDQAVSARRRLRGCRIAALLLIGAGLAAWALVPAGLANRDTVLVISLVWAGTAMLSWAWQYWRDRSLVSEIAAYDAIQGDPAEAESDAP